MTTLPRPDVTTTPDFTVVDGRARVNIVVSRDNKARTYAGVGNTQVEAVSDAVGKILSERASAEWLP